MIEKHIEILKKYNINPNTILEIGSRDANDAETYQKAFNIKNENVFVVEPNPLQADVIRKNYPKYTVFEYAIDLDNSEKDFFQITSGGKDPIGTSSLLNRTDGWYERNTTNIIKVKTMKGSDLMNMINKEIDICKIDVEGLSYEVLISLGDTINKIKSIHIESEYYEFWKGEKLHEDVANLLKKSGFTEIWQLEKGMQADSIWLKTDIIDSFRDIEIHTLICKKDLTLAINNFKSLQRYPEFSNMKVILHDDGSLSKDDLPILNKIKNMDIIWRKDADKMIEKYVENHPHCKSYRLGNSHINLWHKIKLFDYFYFSKTNRILGMDTDLLFLRKPENVIELIKNNNAFYFPDIQSAYCFNEPKDEINVIKNVNTGLIFIPDESYYNIDAIETALSNLVKNNVNYFPSWIEQSAFAHMFYADGRYESLSLEKYGIPYFQRIDIEKAECLHFVSFEGVRNTYESYLNYTNLNGELIYVKNFKIEFEDKKIPLNIKIYEDNGILGFKYSWDLATANINALDHIFEIIVEDNKYEFKFQSEKHGFFSIPKIKNTNLIINHTYDWFGKKNWLELENNIFI